MKDIPGIDEGDNPKNGPFKLYFKNGLPRQVSIRASVTAKRLLH